MRVEIMDITPKLAREWLATNTNNRSIRKAIVSRYRSDMERGVWQLNGEAIVMNGGVLLDGQHRLLACVEADKKFKSIVVFDAPESAMQTIDQGISRNLSDVLRWKGYTDTFSLSAAIRCSWRWDNGLLLQPATPTTNQAISYLEENERLVSAVAFARRLAKAPIMLRPSIGGPVYLKALDVDAEMATEFFDRILDGEHIAHGDPVYAMRRALTKNASRVHGKLTQNTLLSFTIKAWNAWVLNEPLEQVHWRKGGGEKFPVMVDTAGEPISAPQGR